MSDSDYDESQDELMQAIEDSNRHSRFNREHWEHCEPCAEDHWDFIEQCRIDEQDDLKAKEDYDD